MTIPGTCLAAVFHSPDRPLSLERFALPTDLPSGALLCRVRLSTICGSDLHTISGRRTEPAPSILGHESVGEVFAMGPDCRYWNGDPIHLGDRVSWTIMASCGACFYCRSNLPQKCASLCKYGHSSTDLWPSLTGGYAEYIYLFPGTGVFPVPAKLEDAVVAPANCALATVVCAVEAIGGIEPGASVLIVGAGLLGTYLAALAKEAGAGHVLVADVDPRRAEAVKRFGADRVLCTRGVPEAMGQWARESCGNDGVDLAFEVCGDPGGALGAIGALRTGGRLLIAGLVTPNSIFSIDGNLVTRKCLTIRGIHNYRPDHLGAGLDFLAATVDKYPYQDLVSEAFPLGHIHRALAAAREGTHARIAIRCSATESGS